MLIRELENITGLERATIRFYEREGFITPLRHENGYREYSDGDSETLLKVKLLRQLGMPLDTIRELQQGSGDFSAALTDQINALENKIQDAGRAKEVCRELQDSGITYKKLDAAHYLHELELPKPERPSWQPQPVAEFHRPVIAYPWKRFFARRIDQMIFSGTLLFLVIVVFRVRPMMWFVELLNFWLVTPLLWIPVEGILVHKFRTTPGKWLFGIYVESVNGGPLSLSDAIRRAWGVLRYGEGFEIPLYGLYRLYVSYRDYKDYGYTRWDYEYGDEFRFEYYFSSMRKIAMTALIAAYLIASFLTVNDLVKPPHRGEDLTVAQFADNYNWILDEGGYNHDLRLDQEGKVQQRVHQNDLYLGAEPIIIQDNGTWKNGFSDFRYETADGAIRSVTYKQTWRGTDWISPFGERTEYLLTAIASAQDWFGILTVNDFLNSMDFYESSQNGVIYYRNLEIKWTVVNQNYMPVNGGVYEITTDGKGIQTVTLEFTIVIH